MSTKLVKDEIERFLASAEPEVLCIRGKWGTGKTYSWKKALSEAAKRDDGLGRDTYCYVSLFGLNSLTEVKRELFHSIVRRKNIGKEFEAEEVRQSYQKARDLTKITSGVIANLIPGGTAEAGSTLTFLTVRDQLICIDDLERKGEQLRIGDILGLVSMLKEDRNCKVVILLNDVALQHKDEEDFQSYLEKVVDVSLRFAPTPEESVDIALTGAEGNPVVTKAVRGNCLNLRIDNIRVIRKVHRMSQLIADLFTDYEPDVTISVIRSVALFGWSQLQPDQAPPIAFLKSKQSPWADFVESRHETKPRDIEVEGWKAILREYGHEMTTDFDLALIKGVADGYFDPDVVKQHAEELHQRVRREIANQAMRDAMLNYDYDFNATAEDVVSTLKASFEKHIIYLGLEWLGHLVKLFKSLGFTKEAAELIDFYAEKRTAIPGAFDYDSMYRHGEELDPDVRSRCDDEMATREPYYGLEEILMSLGTHGRDEELVARTFGVPMEEYLRLFRANKGEKLATLLRGTSYARDIENPDKAEDNMMRRAAEALRVLAAESEINAMRANSWGLIQRLNWLEAQAEIRAKIDATNQALAAAVVTSEKPKQAGRQRKPRAS